MVSGAEEAIYLYGHGAVSEFFHPFVEIALQVALYGPMDPTWPWIAQDQYVLHQFIAVAV